MGPSELVIVQNTGLVLQRAVDGNGTFVLLQEDSFRWGVGQKYEKDKTVEGSHSAQNQEQELPVFNGGRVDMANAVGNQATE